MSCDDPLVDCEYCGGCHDPVAPAPPRCDFDLPDGVYPWATVTVENGCVAGIQQGKAPLYTPDPCCTSLSVPDPGSGDGDCNCEDGQDGQNATITVGATHQVDCEQPASVANTGTLSHAVLEFSIPKCTPDSGGGGSGATDGADSTDGGILLESGLIKVPLPSRWPPVMDVVTVVTPNDITFTATKDSSGGINDGVVTLNLDLSTLETSILNSIQGTLTGLQNQIDTLENTVQGLRTDLDACCPP